MVVGDSPQGFKVLYCAALVPLKDCADGSLGEVCRVLLHQGRELHNGRF